MRNHSADRLNQLYSEMLIFLQKEERIRQDTEKILAKANTAINPRQEFNKWLKSSEGKAWKHKQFNYQEDKCVY